MTQQAGTAPGPARQTVVTLPAEIDIANATEVGEWLRLAIAPGTAIVVADMSVTTFCDSSGIRMLALTAKQATASGVELRLVVPSPGVLRVMALTGLDRLVPVYPTLVGALDPEGLANIEYRPLGVRSAPESGDVLPADPADGPALAS